MIPLPERLKMAAVAAFHNNSLLSAISPPEREQAAQWYEGVAAQTVGTRLALARLYNLERAKFLRGQIARIAHDAPKFAAEIGYSQTGDKT